MIPEKMITVTEKEFRRLQELERKLKDFIDDTFSVYGDETDDEE